MEEERFQLRTPDDTMLDCRHWPSSDLVRTMGVIVILHGMGEHIGRYDGFARAMVSSGYHVVGYDQRGHGDTARQEGTRGYLGVDGFTRLVQDTHLVVQHVRAQYGKKPVVLFGHSMGSFVAQAYLNEFGKHLDACILSGTTGPQGPLLQLGRFIAKLYARQNGPIASSKMLTRLTFGMYNRHFRPNQTAFDWLTSDANEVQAFLADPLCGFPLSAASMYDLFTALQTMYRPQALRQIPSRLPILLISGEEDPLSRRGKGVRRLVRAYGKAGLKNIHYQLYAKARHELLHETIRELVYQDVLSWLRNALTGTEHKRK